MKYTIPFVILGILAGHAILSISDTSHSVSERMGRMIYSQEREQHEDLAMDKKTQSMGRMIIK